MSGALKIRSKCIKCSGPVLDHESICSACNPAKLATPAKFRAHGPIFVILGGLVIFGAILAALFVNPTPDDEVFAVDVVEIYRQSSDQVIVAIEVTNGGTSDDRSQCRVVARDAGGSLLADSTFATDRIEAGEALRIETVLNTPGLADGVTATCR